LTSNVTLPPEVDAKKLWGSFTLSVIASCCCGSKLNPHKNPDDPFVRAVSEAFTAGRLRALLFILAPPFLYKALGVPFLPPSSTQYLEDVTRHLIKQRKGNLSQKSNDFFPTINGCGKKL
jgi:hypothetical protein